METSSKKVAILLFKNLNLYNLTIIDITKIPSVIVTSLFTSLRTLTLTELMQSRNHELLIHFALSCHMSHFLIGEKEIGREVIVLTDAYVRQLEHLVIYYQSNFSLDCIFWLTRHLPLT